MFAEVTEGTRDVITREDDRGIMFFLNVSRHFTCLAPVSIVPPVLHTNSSITDAITYQHLTPSLNKKLNHTETKNLRKINLTLLRFSVHPYCRCFLQHITLQIYEYITFVYKHTDLSSISLLLHFVYGIVPKMFEAANYVTKLINTRNFCHLAVLSATWL